MSTTDFGTEENSSYHLYATKEMPQAEKRSLLDTVGKLNFDDDVSQIADIRFRSYFRNRWRVGSMFSSFSLKR